MPTTNALVLASTALAFAPAYRNPALPVEKRLDDLLARMTLDEKIGQLTQPEKNSIRPEDVTAFGIGSVLSGGCHFQKTVSWRNEQFWAHAKDFTKSARRGQ